jgi:methylase of polypeptide subunit release factors
VSSPPVPLRVGTPAEASAVRALMDRSGFTEPAVCERLGISTLDAVDLPLFKSLRSRLSGAGALEILSRLFLFGDAVDETEARTHLGPTDVEALRTADLVRVWNDPAERRLFSPVRLVPVDLAARSPSRLLLASDRTDHPDASPFTPFPDIVFSAHNPLTREFLKLLPYSSPGRLLDMCSGTGAAAIAIAPAAAAVVAADVAERSAHFARFNAWINGCADVQVVCGDLYEPLKDRRFDRIIAHPPYVPAVSRTLTYRDGGQTGDEIIQGVIRGMPDHLEEGGTFHLLCLGMDTGDGPFEARARSWLGSAGNEFDIVFALDSVTPPELIATRIIDRNGGSPQDLERWRELFARLQVKEFVYGALVGRRFAGRSRGEPMTRRVLMTDATTCTGFDWLLQWFDWLRLPNRATRVLELKPQLPHDLTLDVRHRIEGRSFEPASYHLENGGRPFRARLATEAWVAALLGEFDGARTVRDAFASAKARGRVPPQFSESELEQLICFLIERGCVAAASVWNHPSH